MALGTLPLWWGTLVDHSCKERKKIVKQNNYEKYVSSELVLNFSFFLSTAILTSIAYLWLYFPNLYNKLELLPPQAYTLTFSANSTKGA